MARQMRDESIKAVYQLLFDSGLSLSKIRDAALSGRLYHPTDDPLGVTGRSLAWKIFLIPAESEPLLHISDVPPQPPLKQLRDLRQTYTDLLLEKMRAPDGSYVDGFAIHGLSVHSKKMGQTTEDLETNNPLSLDEKNPWTEWFASMELRKTIQQDVERTFPDMSYFRDPDIQLQLTNILFLYSTCHPAIGYRQGMHELLAPLFYAVNWDSIPDGSAEDSIGDPTLRELCSSTWVAADSWILFEAVMRGVGSWYEWQDSSSLGANTKSEIQQDAKLYVTPIVQACNHIQSTLLRNVDPLLHKSLHKTGIEPQIYGIRWLRLLFTREFPLDEAMMLWDGLFAYGPSFDLAEWVCVAMLLRIRNKLIPSDYSTQLTLLLHYPAPAQQDESEGNYQTHHTNLLLQQAVMLQASPTTSSGASVVVENRNLLKIQIEVPEPPPSPTRRRPNGNKRGYASSEGGSNHFSGVRSEENRRPLQQGPVGLPEMILKGLAERGESLNINKSLMNAVSEIKKNLPDLAASFARAPTFHPSIVLPVTDERPPEERPPWEPRSRFEMEKEIVDLKAKQKRLGESVSWIVDTLLQDEDRNLGPEGVKVIREKKREALECLAYARDALNSNVTGLEDERLFGEEFRKKRGKTRQSSSGAGFSSKRKDNMRIEVPSTAVPASASSGGVRSKHSKAKSLQNPFTPLPGRPVRSPLGSTPSASPPPTRLMPYAPTRPSGTLRTPSSPSSSSNTPLSSNSTATRFAHVNSNFATPPPQLTATLPRVPPPVSNVPSHLASSVSGSGPESGTRPQGAPAEARATRRDPLGALS